jgi:hypothetical protein
MTSLAVKRLPAMATAWRQASEIDWVLADQSRRLLELREVCLDVGPGHLDITAQAFVDGGYEPRTVRSSKLAPEAGKGCWRRP